MEFDRIEKSVDIDADAETVWALVSTPGWFVNDGSVCEHEIEDMGSEFVIRDPVHGEFVFTIVSQDEPHSIAFRCAARAEPLEATLVEFDLLRYPGGVRLRVIESGFAAIAESLDVRRQMWEGNADGWDTELAAAARYTSRESVERAVFVNASVELVWNAVTDPEQFARWYAFDGASVGSEVGDAVELLWHEHGTFRGRVLEIDRPNRFVYRIAALPGVEPEVGNSTVVEFVLRGAGEGCHLTVRQWGFETLVPTAAESTSTATEAQGWVGGFSELRSLLHDRTVRTS